MFSILASGEFKKIWSKGPYIEFPVRHSRLWPADCCNTDKVVLDQEPMKTGRMVCCNCLTLHYQIRKYLICKWQVLFLVPCIHDKESLSVACVPCEWHFRLLLYMALQTFHWHVYMAREHSVFACSLMVQAVLCHCFGVTFSECSVKTMLVRKMWSKYLSTFNTLCLYQVSCHREHQISHLTLPSAAALLQAHFYNGLHATRYSAFSLLKSSKARTLLIFSTSYFLLPHFAVAYFIITTI